MSPYGLLFGVMLALVMSPSAHAAKSRISTTELWVAPTAPPPSTEAAVTLVTELIDYAASGGNRQGWVREHIRPGHLPEQSSKRWYSELTHMLAPGGTLGLALERSAGIVAVIDGPDYLRVILGSPVPGSSLALTVVVRSEDDTVVIDRIEHTNCVLCEEPARFVRDLLEDVRLRGDASHRLLPGIELDISDHLAANPYLEGTNWAAALQSRNHQGGAWVRLLQGAQVTLVDDTTVHLQYADGTTDEWNLRYSEGNWSVHYASLPETSPLRLSHDELRSWKSGQLLRRHAMQRYEPRFEPIIAGGIEVGDRAIGAAFDPLDGTILVAVMDLDRVLAGLFRVDPDQQRVVERWPISPPKAMTFLGGWFSKWHFALSPDGRHAALAVPNRIWHIDLETRRTKIAARVGQVSALAWGQRQGEQLTLVYGQESGTITLDLQHSKRQFTMEHPPRRIEFDGHQLWGVSTTGQVRRWTVSTGQLTFEANACCRQVIDAALSPDGSGMLVACGLPCDSAAIHVGDLEPPRTIAGIGAAHGGASWSPNKRWFTTPQQGQSSGLVVWSSEHDRPIATLDERPIREVRWSPDGDMLLALAHDGRVLLWNIHRVRQLTGL